MGETKTPEVRVREVEASDLPVLFEHQRDPEANRMAAFPPRDREAFAAHWVKILADPQVRVRTIVADGRVAGDIISWNQDGEREVGYWLGREFWGRGIATRALRAFLAGEDGGPVFGHVAKHNLASLRVLEKCGFVLCGEMRRACGEPPVEADEFVLRWEPARRGP
jgi:RimJ/RimL family protein N-acetyltransferase